MKFAISRSREDGHTGRGNVLNLDDAFATLCMRTCVYVCAMGTKYVYVVLAAQRSVCRIFSLCVCVSIFGHVRVCVLLTTTRADGPIM